MPNYIVKVIKAKRQIYDVTVKARNSTHALKKVEEQQPDPPEGVPVELYYRTAGATGTR